MISSNQGVLVNGGQFTQNNYHGQGSSGNKAPIDILMEAVATNAFHDSGASFEMPKCRPQTRSRIFDIFNTWLVCRDKQFMWLNGAAGCGKSAIAQSCIEYSTERDFRKVASFFFSRSDSTRNHAGPLIATLAYQLYCAFPKTSVQTEILSAIQEDPLIFKKTLQRQFIVLIIQPLRTHFSIDQSVQYPVPFLIIIDGLDECIDPNAQKAILTGLAESLGDSNIHIQIFIASRPEHEIKLSFSSKCLKDIHTVLSLDLQDGYDSESDIRLYLTDRFAEIKDDFNNRTTGRRLDQDWPGERVIEKLVWKSSGQFIYAATVIRYVESTRHRPDHRLDTILNLRPVNGDHPFAELDALYTTILKSVSKSVSDIEKVLDVLSLHLMDLPQSICCSVIEKLLLYNEGEVETLFCDMGALVQVYKDRDDLLYLRFLHASLEEYLLDAARSKQYYINMDYIAIKYVNHTLQYFASCCSSSFDPSSLAGTPMSVLRQIQCWMGPRISQITTSFKLRQSMLSFPLIEFLKPHSTSIRTYTQLLEDFVTPFLELLEVMVLHDPTLSNIQDHQLQNLQTALNGPIQQYLNNDRLASVLNLFYHVGSHRFVPIIKESASLSHSHSTPFYLVPDSEQDDIISLSRIWPDTRFSFGDNIYHRFMRTYVRGKKFHPRLEYAKAALACFKELARTVLLLTSSGSGKTIIVAPVTSESDDAAKDDAYPKLSFDANGGQWQFKYSDRWELDDEELYFILLGYPIFLLPWCESSDALIAACKEHRTHIGQSHGLFPVRRRLLHTEIDKYLARVSPTSTLV
ncbi:hypothetical protein CPC08DRAFT_717422 [Agrocybe pediades]|nr:hypothetical protein CPC08DRAFT_717422 [Agrocybe pediades]